MRHSKMDILSAFALGRPFSAFDSESKSIITGTIQGINLESGFQAPDSPHHFIVAIKVDAHRYREIYIRTID
jgi:hypothetical protein